MSVRHYRFRSFRLDPQARELSRGGERLPLPVSTVDCLVYLIEHRERPVGRDELASAVWGRTDVSEASLNHAIMRLRRAIDSEDGPTSIRTVPRAGYRWVEETTVETPETAGAAESVPLAAEIAPAASAQPDRGEAHMRPQRPAGRSLGARAAVLSLVAAAGILAALAPRPGPVPDERPTAAVPMPHTAAMVLPAKVEAPAEWAWLKLGVMDLIANQLRRGELSTTPSETVMGLVNARALDGNNGTASIDPTLKNATLLIRPQVTQVTGAWSVRLDASGNGRSLEAHAQSKDVLAAAREAADNLLIKLGHTPPTSPAGDRSSTVQELAQRINAAVLAGQLPLAAALIRDAPPEVKAEPEIALGEAAIAFFSGRYEATRAHVEALLDHLPPGREPRLRAIALNRLGATLYRQGHVAEAGAAFTEATALLDQRNEPDILATAYTGRGVIAGHLMQLDEAGFFFGRARALHEMSNDLFGVARVDLNLGSNAMQRGQPATALPIFRSALERFEKLATPEAIMATLRSIADAQSMLLDYDAALATTDRFWPPEKHIDNERERWWLKLTRAVALTGKGRLDEAEDLTREIREGADIREDDAVRNETQALAAQIALLRGDDAQAAQLAASAQTPLLEEANWQDYLGAWLTRVRALQRSGKLTDASEEVKRLRAWTEISPHEWRLVYAVLAQADQAAAEGDRRLALQHYAEAMERAERVGIPEDIVAVGEPFVMTLIAEGRTDEAVALSGRLAQWAGQDMRAASAQAAVYRALGKTVEAQVAFEQARRIAGERRLPGDRSGTARRR